VPLQDYRSVVLRFQVVDHSNLFLRLTHISKTYHMEVMAICSSPLLKKNMMASEIRVLVTGWRFWSFWVYESLLLWCFVILLQTCWLTTSLVGYLLWIRAVWLGLYLAFGFWLISHKKHLNRCFWLLSLV
jgi:hypothetical protein